MNYVNEVGEASNAPRPLVETCPKCGSGDLRVVSFNRNWQPPTFQMGQAAPYGHDCKPTVTLRCTACSYLSTRPGGYQRREGPAS